MQTVIKNAVLGGIAGTVVMTVMMKFAAPMMVGQPMDIAAMIGRMIGDNYMIGMAMHIMMGVVIFPLAYIAIVYRLAPGPAPVRGIIWGIGLWLVAATVVMPMAGAGLFMSEIGGMKAAVAALMGHMVYGALLGMVVGDIEDVEDEAAIEA